MPTDLIISIVIGVTISCIFGAALIEKYVRYREAKAVAQARLADAMSKYDPLPLPEKPDT